MPTAPHSSRISARRRKHIQPFGTQPGKARESLEGKPGLILSDRFQEEGLSVGDEVTVVEAAIELIAERGVNRVRLGDIAEAVGLARTSLYRYFPMKTSILNRWFETAMTPLIDASSLIATSSASRDERLREWVGLQLDFLDVDHNHAMITTTREADDMSDEVRARIAERHRDLYTTLHLIVATRDIDTPEIEGTTHVRVLLIAGLLRGLASSRSREWHSLSPPGGPARGRADR